MPAETFHPDPPPEGHTDGGPAFPTFCRHGQLTVWDYYACEALKGLLCGPFEHLRQIITGSDGDAAESLVAVASELADKAMRAREERSQ